jgi:hypothetical protein
MEKLNQYAPYVLIVTGGLIAALSFLGGGSTTKGYIGLLFMGLGAASLFMKNKKV